jgi:hypothetical protein
MNRRTYTAHLPRPQRKAGKFLTLCGAAWEGWQLAGRDFELGDNYERIGGQPTEPFTPAIAGDRMRECPACFAKSQRDRAPLPPGRQTAQPFDIIIQNDDARASRAQESNNGEHN